MIDYISHENLTLSQLDEIILSGNKIQLSDKVKKKVQKCFDYLQEKMAKDNAAIYGINTGFGSLCNTKIDKEDLTKLQENLVKSHACGMGDEVPEEVVKYILYLKIRGLSYGYSGVSVELLERLAQLYNENALPVIYQQGSLGASGDLAPLAHLSLPLLGMGEVKHGGKLKRAEDVLKELTVSPLKLQAKEGLALLNGTQFMSGYGSFLMNKMHKLSVWADVIGAISLEAFDGRIEPFDDLIQKVRSHNGQIETARRFRKMLKGSEMISSSKTAVQDPYSFRCIPQVHGASKDLLGYICSVFEMEINSVTDNPTIFPDDDKIISGGNFHGQPLALALDMMSIAAAELGSISERRIYKLISGQRGLPPFLAPDAGLNSGFMIPQYAAASIASQNKQLCMPASVDSIDSSNGQEDHVSMGANAATKAYRVVENLEKILAIELMNATQAIEFRRPKKTSDYLENILSDYRKVVPFIKEDVYMHEKMDESVKFIRTYKLDIDLSGCS
jgi:histidine ammonia-lyase